MESQPISHGSHTMARCSRAADGRSCCRRDAQELALVSQWLRTKHSVLIVVASMFLSSVVGGARL
jgi:hypothetical protein